MSDRPSVIQLAGADFPSVLCDDGSVYRWTGAEWEKLPPIPTPDEQARSEALEKQAEARAAEYRKKERAELDEIITDQEALRMQRQHASFWKRWSNFFNRDDGVNHECP